MQCLIFKDLPKMSQLYVWSVSCKNFEGEEGGKIFSVTLFYSYTKTARCGRTTPSCSKCCNYLKQVGVQVYPIGSDEKMYKIEHYLPLEIN